MWIAERLKHARRRAALTLSQVRERTGIGGSSVSEFENGKRDPKLIQLQALAKAYRRSLSFFLGEGPVPQEFVLWREKPDEGSMAIEGEFLQLCEQYHNLETWCEDHVPSLLPETVDGAEQFDYASAEGLAKKVRGTLYLGDRPGNALLRVLEEVCGVKVFHRKFAPSGAAGSTKSNTFGDAVLLNSSNVRWRRNFDLAHELFHLLTWDVFRSETDAHSRVATKQEEKCATCFASNLLMPAEAMQMAINSRMKQGKVSFKALFDIARQFDVSVEALLWRIHYLCGRGPEDSDTTAAEIQQAQQLAPMYEERDTPPPPKWPARYHALAVQALRRGEISIGRFAEYLEISRPKAMHYIEQEIEDEEEIQVAPARR